MLRNIKDLTLEELTVIGGEEDISINNAYTTVKISGSQSISIGTSTNSVNKASNSVSSYNKTNTNTNKNTSTNTNRNSLTQISNNFNRCRNYSF